MARTAWEKKKRLDGATVLFEDGHRLMHICTFCKQLRFTLVRKLNNVSRTAPLRFSRNAGMFKQRMFLITSRGAAYMFPLAILVLTFGEVEIITYRFALRRLVVHSHTSTRHWHSLLLPFSFSLSFLGWVIEGVYLPCSPTSTSHQLSQSQEGLSICPQKLVLADLLEPRVGCRGQTYG